MLSIKYLEDRDEIELMVEALSKGVGMRRLLLTIAMTVLPWAVAQAQIPGKQMVSGQVWPMLVQVNPTSPVGPWCFVGRGLSMFEASADGSDAVISLPEVFYFDGAAYYQLSGQTNLSFATPTSGHIKFKYAPEYPNLVTFPAFSNYTEAQAEAPNLTLVNFSVAFTNGTNSSNCTLPVKIKYQMK